MSKTDEQLISKFMQDHKREIADNGFSHRVMHRLPAPTRILSDILTAICVVLGIILFITSDGQDVILQSLQNIFHHQAWNLILNRIHLNTLLLALAVAAYLGIYRVWNEFKQEM